MNFKALILIFEKKSASFKMLTSKICLSESNLKVVTEKVFLQYDFHEVIGEPDGALSADVIWTNAFKCFTGSAHCCYTFLT